MFKKFNNPTKGRISFELVIKNLIDFILTEPEGVYSLIIGTDSDGKKRANFVSAVIILKKGKGGRYFWTKIPPQKDYTLRERIYQETMYSVILAQKIRESFKYEIKKRNIGDSRDLNLEIHTDVGENGETKKLIKEIVAIVNANGFRAKFKPESFGASCVADHCLP